QRLLEELHAPPNQHDQFLKRAAAGAGNPVRRWGRQRYGIGGSRYPGAMISCFRWRKGGSCSGPSASTTVAAGPAATAHLAARESPAVHHRRVRVLGG